jgi:dCMP deaminase
MSITKPLARTNTLKSKNIYRVPERVNSWDEYFLWMAWTASIKSKDPKCPVGAVIVSKNNVVLSTGFNGFARGVFDDERILAKANEKLKIICHAEFNAIVNAARTGVPLEGATIFVTKFPCLACCNAIIQAGIRRIYTHDKAFWDDDPLDKNHSRKPKVLRQAGVEVDAPHHPVFCAPQRINPRKKRAPMLANRRIGEAGLSTKINPTKKKPPMRVDAADLARKVKNRPSLPD